MHIHLVNFQVIGRYEIIYDSNADSSDDTCDTTAMDGVCLLSKEQVQHNDAVGVGVMAMFPTDGTPVYDPDDPINPGPVYNAERTDGRALKDSVTALPGQVTKIRAKFDKVGSFVWHCHILSHEDHEMMRIFTVTANT